MAATARHPCLYSSAAEAKPSPREAPVMTTLRGSVMARAHTARRPPAAPRQDAHQFDLIQVDQMPTEYGPG
jgi:hypothetical protein